MESQQCPNGGLVGGRGQMAHISQGCHINILLWLETLMKEIFPGWKKISGLRKFNPEKWKRKTEKQIILSFRM